jgi:hypothetical protein
MTRFRLGAAVVLSLALTGIPAGVGLWKVEQVRAAYDAGPPPQRGTQTPGLKDSAETMAAHSDTLTTWGVGLLVWIALVGMTASIRETPWRGFVLLLLAPAAGLLIPSVWASIIFHRRLAYLRLKEALGYDNSLNALLGTQSTWLFLSLIPLAIVTFIFFVSLLRALPQPAGGQKGGTS